MFYLKQAEARLAAGPAYEDDGFISANPVGADLTQWTLNHAWRTIIRDVAHPGDVSLMTSGTATPRDLR